LYELTRVAKTALGVREGERATAAELDRLTELLSKVLVTSGYTKKEAEQSTTGKVRQLVRRMALSSEDAELLLGMIRKIARKE
ncbi:MAG TPA: hypothetical protein VG498_00325, partial [Terriglobales bacterium]|nr:hypothetical protein [Terriglobales bacterium]